MKMGSGRLCVWTFLLYLAGHCRSDDLIKASPREDFDVSGFAVGSSGRSIKKKEKIDCPCCRSRIPGTLTMDVTQATPDIHNTCKDVSRRKQK